MKMVILQYHIFILEGEKVLAYFADTYYYGFKTAATIGIGYGIGELAKFGIKAIAGAGLSLGVTIAGIVVVIAAVAIESYFIKKGLEHLDEKYENKKKEWFEQICYKDNAFIRWNFRMVFNNYSSFIFSVYTI